MARLVHNALPVSDAWCGPSLPGRSTYTARAASCPVAPKPLSLDDRTTSFKPALRTRVWHGFPSSTREIRPIKEIERRYAQRAVTLCGGNLRQAARALGAAVNTLRSWLGKI